MILLMTRLLLLLPATPALAAKCCPKMCSAADYSFLDEWKEGFHSELERQQCLTASDYGWHHHLETEDGNKDDGSSSVTIHQHHLPPPASQICLSLDGSTRYIFSNGVPRYPIKMDPERPEFCPVPVAVSMPASPAYDEGYLEENPVNGPLGFTTSGIMLLGAEYAVNNKFIFQHDSWSGHPNVVWFYWHYHSSRFPPYGEYPAEDELVGYAMDGKLMM